MATLTYFLSFSFGLHLPLTLIIVLVYYKVVIPVFKRRQSTRDRSLEADDASITANPYYIPNLQAVATTITANPNYNRRPQAGASTVMAKPNYNLRLQAGAVKDRPSTPELSEPFTPELARQYRLPSYWSKLMDPIVNITPEASFIKMLVYNLWSPDDVGEGKDAVKVGNNKFIKITKVQRVQNIALFALYNEKRQKLKRKEEKIRCFKDLSKLSTSEVRTTQLIDTVPELSRSPLRMEIDHDINEHYLFHGTLPCNVKSICRTGLSTFYASRVMFGKGVYTAESPTKSDQYTDVQGEEARHLDKKLLLCRVCLGELYIAKAPASHLNSPPCRTCYRAKCQRHKYIFDSAVGDVKGLRFREFVVYTDYKIYPEYIITYDRVDTDDEMKQFIRSESGPSQEITFLPSRLRVF